MNRLQNWIRNHKKQTIAIVIFLLLALCALIVAAFSLGSDAAEQDSGRKRTEVNYPDEDDSEDADGEGEEDSEDADGEDAKDGEDADGENGGDQGAERGESAESTGSAGNAGSSSSGGSGSQHASSGSSGSSGSSSSSGSSGSAGNTGSADKPHTHKWVYVSLENSYHMEYGAECRKHGYNGEEPMFFRTVNDCLLHQMADGCTSSWGSGFKGLAYKYCSVCGEEVVTGHVHDFGTIQKKVYFDKVVCKCGQSFNPGKDYTALESWRTHVDIYVTNGYPADEHNSYEIVQTSVTRFEATKTCSCGWRPVDARPVYQ